MAIRAKEIKGFLKAAQLASLLRFAPVASLLRLPTLGYTFVSPFRSVRFRAGVRSRLIALRFTLRAAFGRLPSQRPLACVRSNSFTLSALCVL